MRKIIALVIAALVLGLAAAWLASNPGTVQINWLTFQLQTSVTMAVALVFVLVVIALALQRLIFWVMRDAPFSPAKRREIRRTRGQQALARGYSAFRLGNSGDADRQIAQARKLLNDTPLALVMAAEVSETAGNKAEAETLYQALADIPETALLGVRGLIIQAAAGDRLDQAILLSGRALELAPKSRWVLENRFDLLSRLDRWSDARDILRQLQKQKYLTAGAADRHRAVLLYCEALEHDLAGRQDEALRMALDAHKTAPGLGPAAALASRLLTRQGNNKKAMRVLEESWRLAPNPLLANAWLAIGDNETASERFRRAARLATVHPDHPESRLLLAELGLAAGQFGQAREQLKKALDQNPTVRTYRLLADLERQSPGKGDGSGDEAAQNWDVMARKAPADPLWICSNCGTGRQLWAPRCTSCQSFDSFTWRSPTQGKTAPQSTSKPASKTHVAALPAPNP